MPRKKFSGEKEGCLFIKVVQIREKEKIHRDLKIPTVKEEISKFSNRYNIRINNHQNPLVTQLLDTTDQVRRLRRYYPLDLNIRFS